MNDKKQLAAMGEHMSEHAAQPLCMAKRIEELEAQGLELAELLRDLHGYIGASIPQTISEHYRGCDLLDRIDAAMAGSLPSTFAPEGWQLVPVEPTPEMILAGVAAQAEKLKRYALGGSLHPIDHGMPDAYRAMLAAATKPEAK